MRKADAIQFFGTQQRLADAVERAQSTVAEWGEVLPLEIAYIVQELTRGKKNAPKFDRSLYPKMPKRLREAH